MQIPSLLSLFDLPIQKISLSYVRPEKYKNILKVQKILKKRHVGLIKKITQNVCIHEFQSAEADMNIKLFFPRVQKRRRLSTSSMFGHGQQSLRQLMITPQLQHSNLTRQKSKNCKIPSPFHARDYCRSQIINVQSLDHHGISRISGLKKH